MKDNFQYKVADFLADEDFRQWVRTGAFLDEESAWNQWLRQHSQYRKEAQRAREILLAGKLREAPFPDDYFETIQREVLSAATRKKKRTVSFYKWPAVAASLVLAVGWLMWRGSPVAIPEIRDERVVNRQIKSETRFDNPAETIVPVALPDGSAVLLHPDSYLTYRKTADGLREVHLTGKAYFEVAKDPLHPFMVYSGEMVTRVVGTSFTITAYAADPDFSVVVKTGNVRVSAVKDPEKGGTGKAPETAIDLVRNERLVFNRRKQHFERSDLDAKEILSYVPPTDSSYTFEDTPVALVFRKIARDYGLELLLDEAVFSGCELTTNLTDEPLFEKLSIVCNAVGPGTSFRVNEGLIQVISKGCNQ